MVFQNFTKDEYNLLMTWLDNGFKMIQKRSFGF